MAYLLLPGANIGQLVHPGAKGRAFTNDEIELALGGAGTPRSRPAACGSSTTCRT